MKFKIINYPELDNIFFNFLYYTHRWAVHNMDAGFGGFLNKPYKTGNLNEIIFLKETNESSFECGSKHTWVTLRPNHENFWFRLHIETKDDSSLNLWLKRHAVPEGAFEMLIEHFSEEKKITSCWREYDDYVRHILNTPTSEKYQEKVAHYPELFLHFN